MVSRIWKFVFFDEKSAYKVKYIYCSKLHLHQLLYRYIRKKKKFNLKIVNSISGMIIIIFNLPSFIIGTYYFFHTKILIIILILNVILYCLSYFILFKNFKIINNFIISNKIKPSLKHLLSFFQQFSFSHSGKLV